MRRPLLIGLLALVVALTAASVGSARIDRGLTDSDIELVDGAGRVLVAVRGALIGSVQGKGTVTITDLPGRIETEVLVQGADSSFQPEPGTTVYDGENLRFRVFRGKWKVRIQGTGIFTSIVGVGSISFAGEGRYSMAGAPLRAWPTEWTTLRLGDE